MCRCVRNRIECWLARWLACAGLAGLGLDRALVVPRVFVLGAVLERNGVALRDL